MPQFRLADNLKCPWLTVWDLTDLFGVGDRCIYRWVAAKKLPEPVRKSRRWSRWRKADIIPLIEKGKW